MSIPQDRRWLWWSEPKVSVLSIANQAAFAIKLGYHMATRKSAEQCRLHSKFKYIWFLLFILFFILNVSLFSTFYAGPTLVNLSFRICASIKCSFSHCAKITVAKLVDDEETRLLLFFTSSPRW